MIANLLVLLLVIGLVVLFGWLCYRAIRAKKAVGQDRRRHRRGAADAALRRRRLHGRQGHRHGLLPRREPCAGPEGGRHAGADRPRRVPGQPLLRRLSRRGRGRTATPPASRR